MKPRTIRKHLLTALDEVAKNFKNYVNHPEKDFSRNRCISFRDVLSFPLSQGSQAASKELPQFYTHSHVPTASAFRQQREEVSFTAFQDVFRRFSDTCLSALPAPCSFHGYHLLAVDGSRLVSAPNPFDTASSVFYQDAHIQNQHHLNVLYSLSHGLYCDAVVQPYRQMNECRALCNMVSLSSIPNGLVLADRNYESYNVFAHLQQKNWAFLIRVKDSGYGSIASGLTLPDEDEFTAPFHLALSRRENSRHVFPQIPPDDMHNHFKKIAAKNPFDFPFDDNGVFMLHFSVVRIRFSDTHSETFIINLDLPIHELKLLYAMRWSVETSFRHLKYAVGLLSFHAKKEKLLLQEIFAALTFFNFSRLIASSPAIPKKKRKYAYTINFSNVVRLCRRFLLNLESSPRIECLLLRDLSPIRPNRTYPRKLHSIGFVSFNYRSV